MTTKPQIISEYEKALSEVSSSRNVDERFAKNQCEYWADWSSLDEDEQRDTIDGYLQLYSKGFKNGANWGSTESPIVKLMESALKKAECTCKVKPYTHQYMYPCERCDAIAALDSLRKWVGNE